MKQRPQPVHSYLFTVRLWWEDLGQGQSEWRGVVKLVTNGEEYFFRDWETLGHWLERMAPASSNVLIGQAQAVDLSMDARN